VQGRANVVRVVIGQASTPVDDGPAQGDDLAAVDLVVLECNIDDLDPRVWPSVLDDLLAGGAADAWLSPILMKTGRPAHLRSVLCGPEEVAALRDRVFAVTSTIGVRERAVRRWQLPRLGTSVELDGHAVAVKVSHRGGRIVQATPEYRDVLAAATALGRPVRDVLDATVRAAVDAGLVPGAPLAQSAARTGGS
jgi:uncharacterized protein (DUF111 family)